jgi:hypothetical protein
MAKKKTSFSQHVTLIILSCAMLGMVIGLYKKKKIDPKLKSVISEVREAEKAKLFLAKQQRIAEKESNDPLKAKKAFDKVEAVKNKYEEQLAGLLSSNIKENDFAAVQQILFEVISAAKDEGLKVFKHESLDIDSNTKKHLYSLSFTCKFEQLTPFVEQLTKLSSPVMLNKLKIENLGEALNIQLEYSL